MKTNLRAVITGDIYRSTSMKPAEISRVIDALKLEIAHLKDRHIVFPAEFYRGDSFQLMVKDPANGLDVAMLLKTAVNMADGNDTRADRGNPIRYDVRLAIAVGETAAKTDFATVNDDVFVRSGRGLEQLKKDELSLGVFSAKESFEQEMGTTLYLWDYIMQGWNQGAAQVFYHKIWKRTESEIANRYGISQPAVNQTARNAGWHPYQRLNQRYRALVSLEDTNKIE